MAVSSLSFRTSTASGSVIRTRRCSGADPLIRNGASGNRIRNCINEFHHTQCKIPCSLFQFLLVHRPCLQIKKSSIIILKLHVSLILSTSQDKINRALSLHCGEKEHSPVFFKTLHPGLDIGPGIFYCPVVDARMSAQESSADLGYQFLVRIFMLMNFELVTHLLVTAQSLFVACTVYDLMKKSGVIFCRIIEQRT